MEQQLQNNRTFHEQNRREKEEFEQRKIEAKNERAHDEKIIDNVVHSINNLVRDIVGMNLEASPSLNESDRESRNVHAHETDETVITSSVLNCYLSPHLIVIIFTIMLCT